MEILSNVLSNLLLKCVLFYPFCAIVGHIYPNYAILGHFLPNLCYNESNYIFREVFENMVAEGVIIPKPDEAPPTVPMDYNWARVITAQSLYNTPCYYTNLDKQGVQK